MAIRRITMSQTLFDTDELVSQRTKEIEGKRCKTCVFCDRYYYERRLIYHACALKGTRTRNHRIKANDQACIKYKEERKK